MGLQGIFRHWHEMRRMAAEIAAIDEADLAGLGVTREELLEFAQMPQEQVARMERMASIFGVLQSTLDREPELRNDILRRCTHCNANATCASVLEADDRITAAECDFCPNAETYAALAG